MCCVLCLSSLGSSWDGLRHGVSCAWWERHKEDKTVHPLRTGSSARWPEGRCSQSLHCGKRGIKKYLEYFRILILEWQKWKEAVFTMILFPSTGDHRHGFDHIWHSHSGARAAWNDGCSGWSSPPAPSSSGQATHYGHWSHLQRLGWDEEPDSPWCTPGGVSEMEAGRRVILTAMWYLKPMTVPKQQPVNLNFSWERFGRGTSRMRIYSLGVNKILFISWQFELHVILLVSA